jgi:putative ABC transport system permease protein
MSSVLGYAFASLRTGRLRALGGAVAIGSVVAATSLLVALASRVERALAQTADPRNVVVLSAGAAGEGTSVLARPIVNDLRARAEVAVDAKGRPLALPELLIEMRVVPGSGVPSFAIVRGVEPLAAELHDRLRLREGRWPRRGEDEVMLGTALAARLGHVRTGDRIEIGSGDRTVIGLFEAASATYEDEAWIDFDDLAADAGRVGTTSIVRLRAVSGEAGETLVADLAAKTQPPLDAAPEPLFYQRQAHAARTLRGLVVLLAALAGTAAAAGLANVFHASVDRRRREIGVLRALGFRRAWVVGAIQAEAMVVAGMGFAIGAVATLATSFLLDAQAATVPRSSAPPATVAESASSRAPRDGGAALPALDVAAADLVPGAVLAFAIGLLAAVGPAWRATRLRPADVLRAD